MKFLKNLTNFLFVILLYSSCTNSIKISIKENAELKLHQPFSFHIEGIQSENPLNPDSIKADLIITSPSGKILSVPAYAYKEVSTYETDTDMYVPFGISKRFWEKQKLPNTGQKVVRYKPTGEWKWSAIFNPSDTGDFSAYVEINKAGEKQKSNDLKFHVCNSDLKGFIRIAKDNPRAFEYDNGENYIPIGNDLSYALTPISKDRLAAYKEWIGKLEASHANIIRVWPGAEWCFGLEGSSPFNYNQEAAFLLDSVFKMCEKSHIGILLCLDYVRLFKKTNDKFAYYRDDYPYMKKNGGTCENEDDFLLRDDAKHQWQALMRYCIARWGAYTSLFSVQLWNEMNCFDSKREYIVRWSDEMCGWLKQNDPYHHLATNSTGSALIWPELWNCKNIDIVTFHDYGGDRYPDRPMYDVFADSLKKLYEIKKPLMLSECGLVDGWLQYPAITHPMYDSAGPKDTAGYAFHEAVWIGFMGGGAGTGMHWWWDIMVNDLNYYYHYDVFYNLTKDIPTNKFDFGVSKPETKPKNAKCFARYSDWGTLLWVVNTKNNWRNLVMNRQKPLKTQNASVLTELKKGEYNVSFYSTFDGKLISNTTIRSSEIPVVITLPDFTIDIFVKLIRKAP